MKILSTLSSAPVYFYKFSFDGHLGFYKRLLGLHDFKGNVTNTIISYLTWLTCFVIIRYAN